MGNDMSTALNTPNTDDPKAWLLQEEGRLNAQAARHITLVWAWRMGFLIVFLGGWELSAREGWVNPFFTSSPSAVYNYLATALLTGVFWGHVETTLIESIVSFVGGSVAAVLSGFLLAQSAVARDATRPFLVILNSMPRIALAPLLIIWFGLGMGSKIAVGISLTYFVVLNATLVGIDSVDPDQKLLSRQLGMTRSEIFRRITLPSSVVSIFAGLNLGLVYGVLGVVVAEMLAAPKGLGHLIQYHAGVLQTEAVLGIIVFLALLVTGLVYGLDILERRLLRWQKA